MVLSSSFVPSPIDLGLIIALCIASGMRFGQEMFSACWVERLKSTPKVREPVKKNFISPHGDDSRKMFIPTSTKYTDSKPQIKRCWCYKTGHDLIALQ